MSLLNKALRKKNKELQLTKKTTPFRKIPKSNVKEKKKIFIAGLSVLGVAIYIQLDKKPY